MRDYMLFIKFYLEVYDIDLFRDRRYTLRGDELVSESTICIGLLSINGSLFEFLLL